MVGGGIGGVFCGLFFEIHKLVLKEGYHSDYLQVWGYNEKQDFDFQMFLQHFVFFPRLRLLIHEFFPLESGNIS